MRLYSGFNFLENQKKKSLTKYNLGEEGFLQLTIPGQTQSIPAGKSRQESEATSHIHMEEQREIDAYYNTQVVSSSYMIQGPKPGNDATHIQGESSV